MDDVFQALAHPIRRRILDYVSEHPGALSGEIAEQFEVSRIAVSKHLKLLECAQLLTIEISGRTREHYFNPIPIQKIYERWTDQYSQFFASKINAFQIKLETNNEEDINEKTA